MCVGSFSLPSGDDEGGYQWEVQTPDGWTLYWEALTTAEGGALGHGVACVLSRVFTSAYRLISVA
jgi:hypothetical protein